MENFEELLNEISGKQNVLIKELERVYIDEKISPEEKKRVEYILKQNKSLKIALENKDLTEINNIYNTLANADNDR